MRRYAARVPRKEDMRHAVRGRGARAAYADVTRCDTAGGEVQARVLCRDAARRGHHDAASSALP